MGNCSYKYGFTYTGEGSIAATIIQFYNLNNMFVVK
jgi:hypothetical protein